MVEKFLGKIKILIQNLYIYFHNYHIIIKVPFLVPLNYLFSSSRLDMENMVLSQPETTDNQCQNDQFIVSGGPPVPSVCGTLTGSHSKYQQIYSDSVSPPKKGEVGSRPIYGP